MEGTKNMKTIRMKRLECGCRRYYLDDKDISDWVNGEFYRWIDDENTYAELTIRGKLIVECEDEAQSV